jgi:hypothetical protein
MSTYRRTNVFDKPVADQQLTRRPGTLRRIVAVWSAALAVCALPCIATAPSAGAMPVEAVSAVITQVYVYNSEGQPVNVTNTMFNDFYGNTYATIDGVTILVVLNHQEGHVYDGDGHIIGYLTS